MNSNIDIRVALAKDAAVLADLLAEMDDAPAQSDPVFGAEQMREVLADMAAHADFRAYLMLEDGRAIGSFSLMIFRSPAHCGSRQALLDAVVVARAQRGRGLGKIMITHALQLASAAGSYKMSLSSSQKRTAAHRFYESLGFTQHGISFSLPLTLSA